MKKKLKKQVTEKISELDTKTHEAFQRMNAMLLTMSARVAEEMNFTLTEILVCEHLRLDGPLTPKDVGDRVGLSSGAVTRLLDRLEARGLTRREPHPADRRKLLMHYVEQDWSENDRPMVIEEKLAQILETMNDAEKQTVTQFMQRLTESMQSDFRQS
jgi:DNA-binding MarR family transcriptional regulator